MKLKNRKGQSTLEYIILVTAVVAVAILFLRPQPNGALFDVVRNSYTNVANGVNIMSNRLTDSWNTP